MRTPKEILVSARKSLVVLGWTQQVLARNTVGMSVQPEEADVVSLCSIGAISRAAWFVATDPHEVHQAAVAYDAAIGCLAKAAQTTSIVAWNDAHSRTKRQVLAAFAKAIKLAEKEESK